MDYSFRKYVESRKKKKKGLRLTLDVEGEPVIVGAQKKENYHHKAWSYSAPGSNYVVVVQQRMDGKWLADMGLKQQYDPHGTRGKQEVFDKVEDALRWVGYPIDFMPMPRELE